MVGRKAALAAVGVVLVLCAAAAVLYYHYMAEQQPQAEWTLEIYVNGSLAKSFSLGELRQMARVVFVPEYGRNCSMVPLWDLLQDTPADPDEVLVKTLKATGADGYTVEVVKGAYKVERETWFYLANAYVCLVEERYVAKDGPLRLVLIGLSEKYWVKFLVKLEIQMAEWGLSIFKDGELKGFFTLSDLRQAPTVEITCPKSGEVVQVINLTDLLARCGLSLPEVVSFTLLAYDGYAVELEGSYAAYCYIRLVKEECQPEKGPIRAVLLELKGRFWVHHLIAIEITSG